MNTWKTSLAFGVTMFVVASLGCNKSAGKTEVEASDLSGEVHLASLCSEDTKEENRVVRSGSAVVFGNAFKSDVCTNSAAPTLTFKNDALRIVAFNDKHAEV